MRDDEAMEQALDAGVAVRRRTAPNPWVGCVIVGDGEIVGRGATEPPGGPHAEVGRACSKPGTAPAAPPRTSRSSPARITVALHRAPTR